MSDAPRADFYNEQGKNPVGGAGKYLALTPWNTIVKTCITKTG
jgi:hypothetical protein